MVRFYDKCPLYWADEVGAWEDNTWKGKRPLPAGFYRTEGEKELLMFI